MTESEMGEALSATAEHRRALKITFVLTFAYFVVEVVGGVLTNSLALLADAAHMLTDVGGLGLALFAAWMSQKPATPDKTYGYYRVEILAALANAVVLFLVSFYILYEAYRRFQAPPEVASLPMLAVAAVGLVVNLVGIWVLSRGAEESLNVRGAFLEVISDTLGSLGVIIAGLIMLIAGWYYADPIFSVLIGLFILPRDYDYSIEGLSGFLGCLLDCLEIERAAFVANSAGGPPVLDFAIRRPERVTALVLASTCGVPHRGPFLWRLVCWPLVGEAMRFFLTLGLVRSNLREMVYDETLITHDVVSAYHEPLRRPGAWRANLKLERNWRPGWVEANLERITVPTLVVWGQDDPWYPLTMAREFGRRIAGAQVEILPRCGHLPHEERPDDFNRLVLEFLAQHLH